MTVNVCGKFINTIGSIYQSISKEELIQHLEINIPTEIIVYKKYKTHKHKSHIVCNNKVNSDLLDDLLFNEKIPHPLIEEISTTLL